MEALRCDVEGGSAKREWETAKISGMTDRTMRRWCERLNEHSCFLQRTLLNPFETH